MKMRFYLFLFTLLAWTAMAWSGTRVAILSFQNNGPAKLQYLQAGVADMLTTTLAQSRNLDVVERGQLDKLVAEMSLGASGLMDPATAAQLGKGAGAQWVVIGSFLPMGKAIRIDAKVVDVESGVVVPNGTISAKAASEEVLDEAVDRLATELLKKLTGEKATQTIQGDPSRKGILEILVGSSDLSALQIDGENQQPDQGTARVVKELDNGTHQLQIYKGYMPPKVIFKSEILVPGGYRVRTKWDSGKFTVVETVPVPATIKEPTAGQHPRHFEKNPAYESSTTLKVSTSSGTMRVQANTQHSSAKTDPPEYGAGDTDILVEPMPQEDFADLVKAITEESFEDNKVVILGTATADWYFSASQMAQLMDLFTYEANKMAVAKMLYLRMVDKKSITRVLGHFGYSNSKSEFLNWTKTQK